MEEHAHVMLVCVNVIHALNIIMGLCDQLYLRKLSHQGGLNFTRAVVVNGGNPAHAQVHVSAHLLAALAIPTTQTFHLPHAEVVADVVRGGGVDVMRAEAATVVHNIFIVVM